MQKGRPLKEVQEALGHKTMTMTLRYAHLAPDNLRAAAASLDDVLPLAQSVEPTFPSAQGSAQEPVPISGVLQNSLRRARSARISTAASVSTGAVRRSAHGGRGCTVKLPPTRFLSLLTIARRQASPIAD